MDQSHEQKIREQAYALWEKEGSPNGRDQEFWERARLMVESNTAPLMATPLGKRSAEEEATDEALDGTFPASDPPAFTADVGARAGEVGKSTDARRAR
jgi:hypothetical protein